MKSNLHAIVIARMASKYLACLVALLFALPAAAAPAFVQVATTVPQTSQSTVSRQFTAAQTAGHLNVVVVGWTNSTAQITKVSDSAGNSYELAVGPTLQSGVESQAIYYAANIAAATANTVTVSFNSSAPYVDLRIAEYSGVATSNPVDGVAAAMGDGSLSSSGNALTSTAGDLLVGANYVSSATSGAGTGFSARVITQPDGDILEDQIAGAAGNYSASAPLAPMGDWIMQLVAFKSAAGTSGSSSDTQPPTAPSNLTATTYSSGQINLSWTASTDNVGVTGYLIERCQNSGCSNFAQVATTSTTSYNDSGLATATSYSYRVRATDAAGNLSGYSDIASATTDPASAAPAIAYVQGNPSTPQTPQTTVTVTYASSQSAGDLNVVAIGWRDQTSHVVSVTDTSGNSYQLAAGPAAGAAGSLVMYVAPDIAAAAAGKNKVVVTFDDAVPYPDVRIAEYGGIATTSPIDKSAESSGSGYSGSSGSVVTTNANDLLIGANYVATSTAHAGAGYTSRMTTSDGNIMEDRTVTATGTYSASATVSRSGAWVMGLIALRAANTSGGSGTSPPPAAPTVSMSASPGTISSGSSTTLTWSSTNASSCTASGGWSGSVATSGTQKTGSLTSTTSYTLSCSGTGGTASSSTTVTVEAANTATAAVVQHVSSSNTRNNSFGSPYCYYFQLPNPTTAGNAVVVGFTFQGNPTATVTDDKSNAYRTEVSYHDTADNQSAGIAAAFNVAAGARALSLCFSANPGGYVQPMATELTNVVGIDGSGSGNNGSGTTVTAGTVTPSASGDVVYQVAASLSAATQSQAQAHFTAGSQANVQWNLLSADLLDGWAGQYGIDSSGSALNPSLTLGSSDKWVSAAILLKSGSAGSVPEGLRIVHLLHENVPYHPQSGGTYNPFPNPVPVQLPCSGNLLVAMIGGGNNPETVTGVTDTNQNTWSQAGGIYTQADNTVQTYYAGSAACSSDLGVSVQFTQGEGDYTIFFYDVAGAAAAPLDTTAGGGGDDQQPGPFTLPFTITPATVNEIVFVQTPWDYNTGVGLSGGFFDANRFSGENIDGPEPIDENNGWGHIITTSTAVVSFTWQFLQPNSDPSRYWAGNAVAFKGMP